MRSIKSDNGGTWTSHETTSFFRRAAFRAVKNESAGPAGRQKFRRLNLNLLGPGENIGQRREMEPIKAFVEVNRQ